MEYIIDIDLIGEILIPLENNLDKEKKTFNNLESLIEKNFNDFRSIIFQGEVLRIFVILKIDTTNDIDTLLEEMFFKLEFDPSCDIDDLEYAKDDDIENDLAFPNNSDSFCFDYDKPKPTDLFSIHRNSLFSLSKNKNKSSSNNKRENKNLEFSYKNLNHDFVSRKIYLKEKKIAIFEILKYIIVPNIYLNRNLILKVNIMKKNNLDFMTEKNYSLFDIYTTCIYNEVREFTTMKTLFKEIKIIRPLNISKIKQMDLSPEISLIEIKIENITSSINFIDRSLKNSKFLTSGKEIDVVTYGIDLTLRDIQILKEETVILNKTILYFKNKEETKYSIKENINLENLNFGIVNNDIPVDLKSGEEFIILMKIIKNGNEFDKIFSRYDNNTNLDKKENTSSTKVNSNTNNSDKNVLLTKQNSDKSLISTNKREETQISNSNPLPTNTIKRNPLEKSITFNESSSNYKTYNFSSNNFKSSINDFPRGNNYYPQNLSLSLKSYAQNENEKLDTSQNFEKLSHTSFITNTPRGDNKSIILNMYSSNNNLETLNRNLAVSKENFQQTQKNNEAVDETDELLKINLSTPIILDVISKKFYDGLFMSIPIKWQYDIMKFINVEIEIQEKIVLHEYFKVYLKIKNLINTKILLDLEVGDSLHENNEVCLTNYIQKDIENKLNEDIPDIISETKTREIGIINSKDEKIIDLRFLPLKNGFNSLPNFKLIDTTSDRRFLLVFPNKIYVDNSLK